MAIIGEEAEWLKNLLIDIPIGNKPVPAVSIHCDCQAAIARVNNNKYNGKSRHIRLRHNTLKQLFKDGVIALNYMRSIENLANPLTKGLARERVASMSRGKGLKSMKDKSPITDTQPV